MYLIKIAITTIIFIVTIVIGAMTKIVSLLICSTATENMYLHVFTIISFHFFLR